MGSSHPPGYVILACLHASDGLDSDSCDPGSRGTVHFHRRTAARGRPGLDAPSNACGSRGCRLRQNRRDADHRRSDQDLRGRGAAVSGSEARGAVRGIAARSRLEERPHRRRRQRHRRAPGRESPAERRRERPPRYCVSARHQRQSSTRRLRASRSRHRRRLPRARRSSCRRESAEQGRRVDAGHDHLRRHGRRRGARRPARREAPLQRDA